MQNIGLKFQNGNPRANINQNEWYFQLLYYFLIITILINSLKQLIINFYFTYISSGYKFYCL